MYKMLLMFSSKISYETLAEELQMASDKFLTNPSEDNKKTLASHCLVFVTKLKIDDEGDLMTAMKNFEKAKESQEIGSRINGSNNES